MLAYLPPSAFSSSWRAGLGNGPAREYKNLIRVDDGAEAVRDDDGCPASGQAIKSLLDPLLGFRVQGRGGFVEERDARILEDGASDGDALTLTA